MITTIYIRLLMNTNVRSFYKNFRNQKAPERE